MRISTRGTSEQKATGERDSCWAGGGIGVVERERCCPGHGRNDEDIKKPSDREARTENPFLSG